MSLTYKDMKEGLNDAAETMSVADRIATRLAQLLVGRLRQVNRLPRWNGDGPLDLLKKELRDYDSCKRKWKKGK